MAVRLIIFTLLTWIVSGTESWGHTFNFPTQVEVQVGKTSVVPFTNSGGDTGRYEVSFVSGREDWMWASALDTGNWETGEIRLIRPNTIGDYTVVFRSQEYQKPETAIDRTISINVTPSGDQGGDFSVNITSLTTIPEADSDIFDISAIPSGQSGTVALSSITGGGSSQVAGLIRDRMGFNGFQLKYLNAPLLLVQQTTTFGPFFANFTDTAGNTASDSFSIKIEHDPAAGTPSAPVLSSVTIDQATGTATIVWGPVQSDPAVNWYSVRIYDEGGLVIETFPSPLTQTTHEVTLADGFTRGVDYDVHVSAHNQRGYSYESSPLIMRWAALPSITGFTPSTLMQGSGQTDVYILGENFSDSHEYKAWLDADVLLDGADGEGRVVAQRVSDNRLKVTVASVEVDAELGPRDLRVRYGANDTVLSLDSAFDIVQDDGSGGSGGGGDAEVTITFTSQPSGSVDRGDDVSIGLEILHPSGIKLYRVDLVNTATNDVTAVSSTLLENPSSAQVIIPWSIPNHLASGAYRFRVVVESDGEPELSSEFSNSFTIEGEPALGSFADYEGHLYGDPSANGYATPALGFGVNASNGNFYTQETDATVIGMGMGFAFTRYYNSLKPETGSLGQQIEYQVGPGWRHSFQVDLAVVGLEAEVVWHTGRRDGFVMNGADWQGVTPGNFNQLEAIAGGWKITTPSKTVYTFNSSGKLTGIAGRNGGTISLAYEASRVVINDTCGRDFFLNIDSSNRVSGVTLPDGRTTSYRYGSVDGVLLGATDRNGAERRYIYNDTDLLRILYRGKTHENHAIVALTYDAEGRIETQKPGRLLISNDPNNYSFEWLTSEVVLTTPEARKVEIVKDAQSRAIRIESWEPPGETEVSELTYGQNSGVSMLQARTLTDAKHEISDFTFSGAYPAKVQPPAGDAMSLQWDASLGVPTSSTTPSGLQAAVGAFDARGNPVSVSLSQPASVSSNLSPAINIAHSYSVDGLLDGMGVNGNDRVSVIERHAQLGLPTKIRYFKTNQHYIEKVLQYDSMSRLTLEFTTGGLNRYFFYDANDNVTDIVAGSGVYTKTTPASTSVLHQKISYDDENRVIEETEAWGSSNAATSYTKYNDVGLLYKTEPSSGRDVNYRYNKDGEVNVVETDPDNREDHIYRQESGRVTNTYLAKVFNDPESVATAARFMGTKRDELGRVVETYYGTSIDSATGEMNGKSLLGKMQWDALGRLKVRTQFLTSDGSEFRVERRSYSSDGRTVTITWDQAEEEKEVERDALGRIIRVTLSLGNESLTTKARYDAEGRLAATIEPSGRETVYQYDGLGRMTSRDDVRGLVNWVYDDEQRTQTRTHPDSTWVKSFFDVFGRMTKLTTSDGLEFNYTYDARSRRVLEDWEDGSREYTYDGDYLSSSITTFSDGTTQTASYAWDSERGRLLTKTYGGRKLSYSYNCFDQTVGIDVTSDTGGASLGLFDFDYDTSLGQLVGQTFPNGVQTTYQRNLAGELLLQKSFRSGDEASPFLQYTMLLDSMGRRIEYDSVQPQAADFSDETISLGHTNGVLSSINGSQVLSDGRKNLTFIPYPSTKSLNYDVLDRVTGINSTPHQYDGARNLLEVGASGSATKYHREMGMGIPVVLNSEAKTHVYGPVGLLGSLGDDGSWEFAHQDPRMNVAAVTAADASVSGQFAYSPYGRELSSGDSSDYPFRFSGGIGHMAGNAGLIHMNARAYSPHIAQFTTGDLIAGNLEDPGSMARWAYVGGDPMNSIDPTGLSAVSGFSEKISMIDGVRGKLATGLKLVRTNAYKNPFKGWKGIKNKSDNLRGMIGKGQGGRAQFANKWLEVFDPKKSNLGQAIDDFTPFAEAASAELPNAMKNTSSSLGIEGQSLYGVEAVAAGITSSLESSSYGVVRYNMKEFSVIGIDSEVIFSEPEQWNAAVDENFNIETAVRTMSAPLNTWDSFGGELYDEFGDGRLKSKAVGVGRRAKVKVKNVYRKADLTRYF